MHNDSMAPELFIDLSGIRTRYFQQGDGSTVVLFHGGQLGSETDACSAEDWKPIFGLLCEQFRAVAVDRLGHGATANPLSDADFTMAASIRHAVEFLRALKSGPYHLVGHSTGGFLVTRIALEHPDLVRSCVVADGVSLYPGTGRDHIVRQNPPLPRLSQQCIRWVLERLCYDPNSVTDDWVEQMSSIADTQRNRTAVHKMQDQGLKRTCYVPNLGKLLGLTHQQLLQNGLKCPTLLTWTLNDPAGDVANGRLLVEMFQAKQPETEVRYFNRVGHYGYREQPKTFGHMLKHYLSVHS